MFKKFKKWFIKAFETSVYIDNEGPQIEIDIRAPKEKIGSCLAIMSKSLWRRDKGEEGSWLCTNVGGDHFLVEVSKYEIYVEYLTTSAYEVSMKYMLNT